VLCLVPIGTGVSVAKLVLRLVPIGTGVSVAICVSIPRVVLLVAIPAILWWCNRVVSTIRSGHLRIGHRQCMCAVTGNLDLILEPDEGHTESLLLLLDIAQQQCQLPPP
jgi:hypothetical protein